MFETDLERIRHLYSELLLRQSVDFAFEERFRLLDLHYRLEDLLAGQDRRPGEYRYCFFVNHRGIRHLEISAEQAAVAAKIKAQAPLNLEEKIEAIRLLRMLSA